MYRQGHQISPFSQFWFLASVSPLSRVIIHNSREYLNHLWYRRGREYIDETKVNVVIHIRSQVYIYIYTVYFLILEYSLIITENITLKGILLTVTGTFRYLKAGTIQHHLETMQVKQQLPYISGHVDCPRYPLLL